MPRPVFWELSTQHDVIPNIRSASVRDDIGIVAVEIEGKPDKIQAAREWLEELGVDVEPVELNVIE